MNFKIYFGDESFEIGKQFIKGFSFTSDISSIYTTAKLLLTDFTRSYFNEIQKGMDIIFTFFDGATIKSSTHVYKNVMKVLSFSKVPSPQTAFDDTTELNLIHCLYFIDGEPDTKAYEGTFYSIASEVLGKFTESVKLNLSITDDTPAVRYQLGDSETMFLSRVSKYGIQKGMPVYIYVDATNTINLKGIAEMSTSTSFYTATPILNAQVVAYNNSHKNDAQITLTNYRFASDKEGASQTDTYFTIKNFKSNVNYYAGTSFLNTEYNNVQTNTTTPKQIDFQNWNLTPQDAMSITKRQNFEDNLNTYYMVATVPDIAVDSMIPGTLLKVILPYDTVITRGVEKNLSEGEYIVKRAKYVYDRQALYTQIYCIQANY